MSLQERPGRDRWEYEPDTLGRIGQGNWRRILAAGPFANEEDDPDTDVAALRRAWRSGQPFPILRDGGGLHLGKGVGRNQPNERADVARLEVALARAGYHDINSTGGPTGYWGPPQEEALRRFQKDAGVTSDGFLEPGQETHTKMNEGLAKEGQRAPGNQVAAGALALPFFEAALPSLARAGLGIAIGGAADQALNEFAKNPTLLDPTDPFLRRELRYPEGATPFPSGQSDFTGRRRPFQTTPATIIHCPSFRSTPATPSRRRNTRCTRAVQFRR
jgi:peptidoglycan hydrolase-like protein with peptidoglycan-binding domain